MVAKRVVSGNISEVKRQRVKKVAAMAMRRLRSYKKCLNLLFPGSLMALKYALMMVSVSPE